MNRTKPMKNLRLYCEQFPDHQHCISCHSPYGPACKPLSSEEFFMELSDVVYDVIIEHCCMFYSIPNGIKMGRVLELIREKEGIKENESH